jgi:hypothetical protein
MASARVTRATAAAARASGASAPHALALVFARLPADARLRCAGVCRAWRAVLAGPELWSRLDLSASSGVTWRVTGALLRGLAARARGSLHMLDVSSLTDYLVLPAIFDVIRDNKGALRDVRATGVLIASMEAMVGLLPQCTWHMGAVCSTGAEARALLRRTPPFERVQLDGLCLRGAGAWQGAELLALAADMRANGAVRILQMFDQDPDGEGVALLGTPAVADALLDAARACGLRKLSLSHRCCPTAASVPALARLIRAGELTELFIAGTAAPLVDETTGALLGAALLSHASYTVLKLVNIRLWEHPAAAEALIAALLAHPGLHTLHLPVNRVARHEQARAGAALAVLLAADAPALLELDISHCDLGDDGMRPLCAALARNKHVRTLRCEDNGLTAAFAREVLLPAVRANTSLRLLVATDAPEEDATLREVEALVAARSG